MKPGRLLIRALLGLCLASLLVPFVPVLVWVLGLGLAAIVAMALLEALELRRLTVTAELPEAWVLSLDEDEVLPLRITTSARRPVSLTVRQVWPRLLEQASSVFQGVCRPGEVLAPEARVRAVARGGATLERPWASATFDGWMERSLPAMVVSPEGAPISTTEITVLPNLRAVKRLRGKLDRLFLQGFGSRTAPRLGKGRDFDRLREYVIGDDLRDVAWKASARHSKLITREYRLDRSQDILICLDRGHRMAARVAHVTRLDHAVNAAVLLASICNRMEDRFGLLSFADSVEQGLAQGRGAGHLRKITAYSAGVMPEYLHTDYLALGAHLRRRLRSRALVLILTALPELEGEGEIVRAVEMLVPQHLPVVIVLSDPAMAAAATFQPEDKPELCRTLVARDLWLERRKVLAELRRRGALVAETVPGDAGLQAVNSYLEVKRRQLL